MGCCFSKTPSQRSSRSSEKVQSHYAPTAPSWDIIDSSSVYTSERRDEERSSESKRQISDQKIAVYKKRNDCLFYYHHKCSKGDNCEYRHERAALGSRRTCSLWKDQKCLREHCPLRHMKLKNNKKPCFLEEGGVSCYVEGCPFKHLKSEDKQGDNDASKANCSKVETENKRDNNAGDHNKSGEPKHHDEKINRSGCHPQFDNEKQSTNSAAAVGKFKKDREKLANAILEVSMLYLMVWIPNLSSAVSYVSISAANNAFGLKLYKALGFNKVNVFYSPLSTHMAVTMVYIGSRKDTAHNLAEGLVLPVESIPEHVGESYRDLLMLLQDTSTEGALNFASKVFVDYSAVIKEDYKKSTEKYFLSEAMDVDFCGSPELACLIINDWVQTQTIYTIKDILKPGSVSEDTRMVLASALSFKGRWFKRFDSRSNFTDTFQVDSQTSKSVSMMRSTGYYSHAEYADSQVLALEYEDSDIVMLVMLPKSMDGLEELEGSLQNYDWNAIDDEMLNTYVEVQLPQFQIETWMSLSEVLNKIGLTCLFDDADFSGITDTGIVKVDEIAHKACIDVNQEGSMVAPPSGDFKPASDPTAKKEEPKLFKANHPFFFLIRHEISKAVLFMGRFYTP